MQATYCPGDLVAFHEMKNARGYPATGEIVSKNDDGSFVVSVYGIPGPGAEIEVRDVPASAMYPMEIAR